MYSRLLCIAMLFIILLSNGCQKLSNDPGGDNTTPEVDNGLIYWGGAYNDEGMAVVQTFDGGYAVAGSKYSATNQADLVLAIFNSQLEHESDTTEGGLNGTYNNSAKDLIQTSDGGYVLVGTTFNGTDDDVWVVKFNSSLAVTSQDTIRGAYDDVGSSIWEDGAGNYVVCGSTYDGNDWEIALWKFNRTVSPDSTVTLIYTSSNDGTDDYGSYAFQTEGDNGYVIVGKSWATLTGYDVRLINLTSAGETGAFDKTYTISGADHFTNDEGIYVQRTSSLGFVVVGNTFHGGNESNVFVLTTDKTGIEIGNEILGRGNNDAAYCVRQIEGDNGYILVGSTYSRESSMDDVWVVRLTNQLTTVWSQSYGASNKDVGTSISQTNDGGFIITGYTYSYGNQSEILLLKIDGNGVVEDNSSDSSQ